MPGDEVYFHHPEHGASHGKVLCHGKHGCTIDHKGQRLPVRWDRVLGHRKRAPMAVTPIDRGEDGMIADHGGQRVYIHGDIEQDEQPTMKKSIPLLFKAFPQRDGKQPAPMPAKPPAADPDDTPERPDDDEQQPAPKQGKFGPHNVKLGDGIGFTAGAFEGKGRVTAAGDHGAHVADHTGREHQVHWHEVTDHDPQEQDGQGEDDGPDEPDDDERPPKR